MPTLCGHFCYMATYSETIAYFEGLCTNNLQIAHSPTKKKFFRMNIEEFLSGTVATLPNHADGPCFVFINYIGDYGQPTQDVLDTKQLMFYILHGSKHMDYNGENTARTVAEDVLEQFILKMQYDSQNDHVFFDHSFDQIKRVRRIPVEVKTATGTYVGYQCSMYLSNPVNKCHNPLNWLP